MWLSNKNTGPKCYRRPQKKLSEEIRGEGTNALRMLQASVHGVQTRYYVIRYYRLLFAVTQLLGVATLWKLVCRLTL